MAENLDININANLNDNVSGPAAKIEAEKAALATPVEIPVNAPGLVPMEFTLKSLNLQMEQLRGAGTGGGTFNTVTKEADTAAKSITAVGVSASQTGQGLYRLAQIGAGTGVALGGITDRGLAAAASLALMGSEFLPFVAIAAGIVIAMKQVGDAFGTTEKLADDMANLDSSIGSTGDSVATFSKRIHDMAHDAGSLGNIFANLDSFAGQLKGDISEMNFDAQRKGMQLFNDVLKDSPAAAFQLVQALSAVAENGKTAGENIGLTSHQLEEMNKKVNETVLASAAEADNQAKLKDAVSAVTAARQLGIDATAQQGEESAHLVSRLENEALVLDQITQHETDAATASAAALALRTTAAASMDVATQAALRGIDATGQNVLVLGEEVAAYQSVTAALEKMTDATVAQQLAQAATKDLTTARLEAAQLGLQVSGLGADATNRAIIAQTELNQTGKDTVESAALQAAAKKKLTDAEALWTKAVEAGLDPARIAADQLKGAVADAEANAKATNDMVTAQGDLARVFDYSSTFASDYAVAVGEAAKANSDASKEQQLVNTALEDGIDPLAQNAEATQLLIDQHDALVDSNKKLQTSLDELDTKWVTIRDSVGGVEGDAQAFTKAWATATEQVFGLADTFDDVAVAADTLTQRESKHGAILKDNDLEGAKQLTLLEKIRQKIGVDLAEAYRNSGGDLTKLRERGDFWSTWLDENLPKDLDTAAAGVQGWREKLGDIPTLIQTSLEIAVQQEALDKLDQVKGIIELLPPELQTQIQLALKPGGDATKVVKLFDFLAKVERIAAFDVPVNVHAEIDKLLIAGNFDAVQKLLEGLGFHVELPTEFAKPAPLDPATIEATTGKATIESAVKPPDPQGPGSVADAASQGEADAKANGVTVSLGTTVVPPDTQGPGGVADAAYQATSAAVAAGVHVSLPVSIQVDAIGDATRALSQALELPPGVDLTDPTKGLPLAISPYVIDAKLADAIEAINTATVDPNTGGDRQANINVTQTGADDVQTKINNVATNNGKGYTTTIHVTTDVPVPGLGDSGVTTPHKIKSVPTSAPSVHVTQNINAGAFTDRLGLQKTLRKASRDLDRLVGIRR